MSDFWKVAATFIGVIGAAAIIFQLNKGTLVKQGTGAFTTVIGDAFTTAPTNKTSTTKGYSTTH